jgi:ATP-dependent Clp protease ATP-binding subunit ClpC
VFGITSAFGFGGALVLSVTTETYVELAFGIGLVSFGLWVEQFCLATYYNTWHLRGADSLISSGNKKKSGTSYEVAMIAFDYPDDCTRGFFMQPLGKEIALRLVLPPAGLDALWSLPRTFFTPDTIILQDDAWTYYTSLASYLYTNDDVLREFLTRHAISENTWLHTIEWVERMHLARKRRERWWSRDGLSNTTGIGKNLAFGIPYELEQCARSLYTSTVYADVADLPETRTEIIARIEETLAKTKGANILLIGNAGVGAMDILVAVDKRLRTGRSLNALSGQHLIALDADRLFALYSNPSEFEMALLTIFEQAARAGNVTIVIEHIGTFIKRGEAIGIPIADILDVYLATPELHIIGVDTPHHYHTFLEPLGGFTRRFEELIIDEGGAEETIPLLLALASARETQTNIITTYDGIAALYDAAKRYVTTGDMPERAVTLLLNICDSHNDTASPVHLTPQLVYDYISRITGIPVGPVLDEERDRLLHLEDILHTRVVGQDAAISAIARTMRRARVDIERHDKPIGTFLFLGPTGVGKTETAKALAHVFFGDETAMYRFDMSEFNDTSAVVRLIGDSNNTGLLSDRLREHPYSVVLFDELEKAHSSVHDLLLQILDEGQFMNGRGETVSARTTIIIATSNAGSTLIVRTIASRQNSPILNQEIINHIIEEKIFKPELINRFDSTIVFEPLTSAEQYTVATLMLRDLRQRMIDRGYRLELSPSLIAALAAKGYDPRFGARPMARVLQDLIEERIATRIIDGTLKPGDLLTLDIKDFLPKELAPVI